MKALLRKDAAGLIGFAVVGLLFHLFLQSTQDGPWIRPEDRYTEMAIVFLWFAATLLGLVAATVDDLVRTREYLQHRSVSPARIFWTRQLGGAAVLTLWILATPALHLLATLLFRADAHLVEAGRYWHFVDETTVAFVFYAIGVFSGSLVRRLWLALPVAGLFSTFLAALCVTRVNGRGWWVDFPVWTLAVPLSLALLAAAAVNERQGRDADIPWNWRRLVTSGVVVLVMVVPGFSFLAGVTEAGVHELLLEIYPGVARLDDGSRVLFRPAFAGRRLYQVDAEHRLVGELPATARTLLSAKYAARNRGPISFGALPERSRPFHGRHLLSLVCPPGRIRCFIDSRGYVEIVRETPHEDDIRDHGAPSIRRIGQPDGQPFPPDAMPIGLWWQGRAFIGDPKGGAVWAADLTQAEPSFTRVPLPLGDRFRADVTSPVHEALRRSTPPHDYPLTLRGDRGVYVANPAGRLQPAPAPVAEAAAGILLPNSPQLLVTKQGPLAFHLALAASASGQAIEHDFRPRTLVETLLAATFYFTGAVRPAAFALLSRGFDAKSATNPSPAWVFDLHAGTLPIVIPLASLAIALGLAWLTWRRLGRSGAEDNRRIFWAIAVGLGGLPAYACARAIESRRVWLPLPQTEQEPADVRLLIQPS